MKIINKRARTGEVRVLKRSVSNFNVKLEVGDSVEVIGVGDRGYDVLYNNAGVKLIVLECGWDIFEESDE